MTYPLQQFAFDKSAYERPTQPWVCGWTEEGRPCQIGPDRHGRCRATFHCQPIKKGDRWHCTRSPNYGGPCEQGPQPDGTCCRPIPPCQPVRSMRARRTLAVRISIALTVGFVIVMIFGPFGEDFISPGPLTAAHSSTTADSCRSCHSAAEGQAASWVAATWKTHSASDDARKCLHCHGPEAVQSVASSPHSMSYDVLRHLRTPEPEADQKAVEPVPWRLAVAEKLIGDDALTSGDAACSACHREHHGRNHLLAQLDNEQCQACHQVKFASFVHGHPEFSKDFPHTRRTRIAFNHAAHVGRLASSERARNGPTDCTDCHTSDATHRHMVLMGFDTSCSTCHGAGVRRSGEIKFIELPSVDLPTLAEKGIWIGRTESDVWPQNTADDETELGGFLKLMLAADADHRVAEAIELLDSRKVSLYDLADSDAETLQAVARVVWSLKGLMHDFAHGGNEAIRQRFDRVFKREKPIADGALAAPISEKRDKPFTDSAFAALIGEPEDAARQDEQTLAWNVKQAVALWMGGLDEDIGEYRRDPDRMTGHAATPPEITPAPEKAEPPPKAGGDESAPDHDPAPNDNQARSAPISPQPAELVALGMSGEPGGDDEPAGGDDAHAPDDSTGGAKPAPAPAPAASPPKPKIVELDERAGRWHLRPKQHAIVYLPTGHADAFMRSWLDATAAPKKTSAEHVADSVFRWLSNRDSGPGRCGDCHSVDRPDGQEYYEVNWHGQRPESPEHSLTNYAHGPHFNRPELRNCQACHEHPDVWDPKLWKEAYSHYDPSKIAPSLPRITKSKCVNCHTPDGAGDSCLMCHKYHRTAMAATPTSARLAERRSSDEASQPRPGPEPSSPDRK